MASAQGDAAVEDAHGVARHHNGSALAGPLDEEVAASLFGGEDAPDLSDAAPLVALLSHPLLDDQGITRLVFRVPFVDAESGSVLFFFTMTASIEEVRHALATGEQVPEDQFLFQIEVVEP